MINRIILGVLMGGTIGAILGYFGKCASGSCPLTATPYRGAIYGAVVGAFLAFMVSTASKERPTPLQEGPVSAKETTGVSNEKNEISKDSPGYSKVVHTDSESDMNGRPLQENVGNLMESLTKESFLQKVFNYEQNKEWKFEGALPCIIDFYADWCGPCKMVEPILQELAKEYQGKLNIYRINTQEQQELAGAFGIQSIPSLLYVPLNDKPQMVIGALPKHAIKEAINEILNISED